MRLKILKIIRKKIEKVIEDNVYFTDISEEYIEKQNKICKSYQKQNQKYNIIFDDFCFHNFDEKFDFIIGNPPYVRIQNLNGRKEKLQKTMSLPQMDQLIYIFVFEQALRLLNKNGKIAFITPNSHFHSAAGNNLRNLMLPHLTKIINFDHYQVFKDATAYTAITFLQIENRKFFIHGKF